MNLMERKEQLLARRDELMARIEKIKHDISQSHSSDSVEQAQERENDEVLESLGNETRRALSCVNAALELIERGEYGVCQSCGEHIAAARLDAVPDATRCVNCAV